MRGLVILKFYVIAADQLNFELVFLFQFSVQKRQ